jgi:hypothetical protein
MTFILPSVAGLREITTSEFPDTNLTRSVITNLRYPTPAFFVTIIIFALVPLQVVVGSSFIAKTSVIT